MTLLKLVSISFLLVFSSFQYQVDPPIDCFKTSLQVKKDQEEEQLKYYYFGITQLSPTIIGKLKSLYQVEVISTGCLINEEQVCYNQTADTILKTKTGKDFYGLVEALK